MPQIQTTLPEVIQEETIMLPKRKYMTKYFEVSANQAAIDKVLEQCEKKSKAGMPYYTADEKRKIKMMFVQKKMRCVSVWPLFLGEWSDSALAIYREIFNEVYN